MMLFKHSGKAKAMTSLHRKVLTKVHSLVMETMVFSDVLRSHLITDEVLELDEARNVREKSGHNAQNSCLLELLQRKPDYAYYSFLEALEKGNQKHVADIIKEKEAELEEEETLRISQMSNLQSSSSKASEACCHESYKTSVMRYGSGANIVCLNSNNSVALPGKPAKPAYELEQLTQNGWKSPFATQNRAYKNIPELPQEDRRPKHRMSPEPQMSLDDGSPSTGNNTVALPRPPTKKERRFQERRRQKQAGKTNSAQPRPLAGEGCMVGVKVFIREVCTNEDKWSEPKEFLKKAIENYIWATLSQVLTRTMPEDIPPEIDSREEIRILRFLLRFQDYWCKVKHVGFEPVLFVVQCTTADSLETLLKVDEEGTLAEHLGDAMSTETLARRLNIKDLMLETEISELEVKLAKRILNERVATVDVKVQSTPEKHLQLEYEWCEKVQTDLLRDGTAIHTAVQAFSTEVREIKKSSILFTLQFYSKEDLNTFRENLDSGQLAHLFEKALITEEAKQKYGLDTLGLSLTMVDPWEYDMCEMELEPATFEKENEYSSEDESAEEGQIWEPHDVCCEHIQTIENLEMTNKKLREKCDSLQQALTQVERKQCKGSMDRTGDVDDFVDFDDSDDSKSCTGDEEEKEEKEKDDASLPQLPSEYKYPAALPALQDLGEGYDYDVFAVCGDSIKSWTGEHLLKRVIAGTWGYKIYRNFYECAPGVPTVEHWCDAFTRSRKVILCLTDDFPWDEWNDFITARPHADYPVIQFRKILPIKLTSCGCLPPYLDCIINYLDWPRLQKNKNAQNYFWQTLRYSLQRGRNTERHPLYLGSWSDYEKDQHDFARQGNSGTLVSRVTSKRFGYSHVQSYIKDLSPINDPVNHGRKTINKKTADSAPSQTVEYTVKDFNERTATTSHDEETTICEKQIQWGVIFLLGVMFASLVSWLFHLADELMQSSFVRRP